MEEATPAQLDKIKEFRGAVKDVLRVQHTDVDLYKWLKARKFDVDKAEAMYRKSMAWRGEMGADRMLTDYKVPEVMDKYYPGGFCGEDKVGRPIWIDPLGRADLKGIMYSVKKSDIVKTMVRRLEDLYREFAERSASLGKPINQCVHIVDMEGFGSKFMWKPALDLYIEILRMLEENYPETLHKTFIIKAPKIFKIGYNVIKQFIDKNTVAKFVVCDHGWKEEVMKVVDLDVLPQYYGGKATDPDGNPKVESKVCYGGDVPKSFYRKKEEFFPSNLNPNNVTLHRGGSFRLMYIIPEQTHVIRWIFATEVSDIEFGVYREPRQVTVQSNSQNRESKVKVTQDELDTLDVVVPCSKYEVHRVPEDGMFFCESPGTYILLFKNPSKLVKRTLTYSVEVVKMSDDYTLTDASKEIVEGQQLDDDMNEDIHL